jgi:hypothetical protein
MKNIPKIIVIAGCMLISTGIIAREVNVSTNNPNPTPFIQGKIAAECAQTTALKDLDINNVRARVLVGGDMFWDQGSGVAQYEVPRGTGKTSVYAGAIWVGGLDAGGNIKAAAQTYRQTFNGGGNDFFAGPIDLATFSITPQRCNEFDRHWKLRYQDVVKYSKDPANWEASTPEEIESRQNILSWPGNGQGNEDHFLAPYADVNGDGAYTPEAGDYPRYAIAPYDVDYPVSPNAPKTICNDYLFGDQTIWWVFNDVGGIKQETDSPPIGLEIRTQAFAFKTNDEINNMTFYKYQIINRSSSTFQKTYFGQWVDADLGYYKDDYVRCNVKLGLGFTYNGDAVDDLPDGYGATPPAIGFDFFQGPSADVGDSLDNDRDGCFNCTFFVDPATQVTTVIPDSVFPEQIIMSKFVYFNNTSDPVNGNPVGGKDYYNYLRGIWRNDVPMTYGGNGYNVGSTDYCDFMFPGTTDPVYFSSLGAWSEETVGNPVDDRRMIQSAGPFTLLPGAVNYITVGAVWARPESGDNLAALTAVELADKKAQALFDNCFKTLDGPDAPDLVIRELDKELIISLQNTDNIQTERYSALDPTIVDTNVTLEGKKYKFQGYQVYQLKSASNSVSDLQNHPDDIKLLFQCDIKDSVNQIVNYTAAPFNVYTASIEVNGADAGISHTFKVDKDLFASGNNALVNHKNYYYTVVAYAYNNYKPFDPQNVLLGGQQKPYLAGRNNIKVYTAIPHIVDPENGGTVLNSNYGDGPVIKRIEGQGNGGMVLDFTQAAVDELLNSWQHRVVNPEYKPGRGPIDVKVYDPVLVQAKNFITEFNGIFDTCRWKMTETNSGVVVREDTTLSQIYEQVLSDDYKQPQEGGKPLTLNWGISANIHNVIEPGKPGAVNNGFLEATISYADNAARWLNFVANTPGDSALNWIRSTKVNTDSTKVYENVLNGTWAPLKVCAITNPSNADSVQPKPTSAVLLDPQICLSPIGLCKTALASVDVVFTSDKSKWSRATVLEMGNKNVLNIGGAYKYDLRASASIDKDGNSNYPSADNNDFATGMSWFPGYAYNLETGERLNIAFGENSTLTSDNGNDMKWNPSTRVRDDNGNPVLGGMHYIYVFGHNEDGDNGPLYDGCTYIHHKLDSAAHNQGNASNLRKQAWKDAMWVSEPLLANGKDLNQTDITVRLRVARNYRPYNTNLDASTYLNSSNTLTLGAQYYVVSGTAVYNAINYTAGSTITVQDPVTNFSGDGILAPTQNGAFPKYEFNTNDLASELGNMEAAKDALKLVNVVPNPYYAYSAYEGTVGATGTAVAGQLDNRIKITNLPPKCTISIFTMNGALIRRFVRDVQPTDANNPNQTGHTDNSLGGDYLETSIDWDLKNTQGISIASGIYLIHVDAGELGKRTLKWFGVLRPIDVGVY